MTSQILRIDSVWWHTKTGNSYVIVDFVTNATNAQDGQQLVIYRPLEGGPRYARDRGEFTQKFCPAGSSYAKHRCVHD